MYSLAKCILQEINENFIGIFLYGSQNYGLDDQNSDKDAILLVRNFSQETKKIKVQQGIVKIYTLKRFLSQIKKGDLECYEILYTQHCFINPQYVEIFNNFVQEFSQCVNMDRIKRSLSLKLREHLMGIMWIPSNQNGSKYHKKRVYQSYRVSEQLKRIINGETLRDTFIYPKQGREKLLKIKSIINYLSLGELNEEIQRMYNQLKNLPKYDINLTTAEIKCLSSFYSAINSI